MTPTREHPPLPKVLWAIGSLGPGGAETQLCELVTHMHGRSIDAVVLVNVADPGARLEQLRAAGVPIVETGKAGGRSPTGIARLLHRQWKALGEIRPDVLYVWLEEAALSLVPLARLRRIPVAVSRQNSVGSRFEVAGIRGSGWAVRHAERLAQRVHGNSRAVVEHAASRGIERDRLRLIENAISDREVVPPPPPPPVRIGYLCQMRPEKGHLRMLRILDQLPDGLDWVAKVGGSGPMFETVRAELARRGLEDRVQLCGVVDPTDFWDDCHIAMLTSDSEGSPNSLLQAARAGRPLFATAVDGNTDMVTEGIGLLVDPADDGEAADRLAELIADADLRHRLGMRAREVALTRHDPDAVSAQHLAMLNEAAGGGLV